MKFVRAVAVFARWLATRFYTTEMEASASTSSEPMVELELDEVDIPRALLSEPMESNIAHALRWWLLCRRIKVPISWKKSQLLSRLVESSVTNVFVCS